MKPGSDMWRKDVLYDILDGKSGDALVQALKDDVELKDWRCKAAGECMGFTLLHGAVRFNNTAALTILLSNGAVNITAKDKVGKSPFDWAILNSEVGMVRAMLDVAVAGTSKMPNLELALRNAEEKLNQATRSGTASAPPA